jgi:murein DD-endopeptidase MepM/ murein hydrolase activator NlpD
LKHDKGIFEHDKITERGVFVINNYLTVNHNKSSRRLRFTRRFALVLSFTMLFLVISAFQPVVPATHVYAASTSESIADAKKKKEEAQKQIDEAKAKVAALSGQTNQLSSDLADLNQLSTAQKTQYTEIAGELEAALAAKQDALDTYLASQDSLDAKKAEYSQRMSVMFEYQNKSALEILLESDSIAGFFTNLELITLIGDSDNQIIDELKAAMDDAELKSTYAQKQSEDMQKVADEKQAELDELAARIGKTSATLQEKQADLSDWQKKEDALNATSDALDSTIAALQKELAAKQAAAAAAAAAKGKAAAAAAKAPPQGSLTWPYPGDYVIHSGFGMRMHPIYHVYKMHTGVDLGGAYGNPIVAAAAGTVIIASAPVAGQNTGGTDFGNYIVIDHGGGVATLYGHCKELYVSVGDTVVAGQKIAACGSTGTSTGPHLHFEVRINGVQVDPAPYIT